VCTDRALRSAPTKSSETYYAFISAIRIDGDWIDPIKVPAGFLLRMKCEYLPYLDGAAIPPALKLGVYSREGLLFGAPYGDLFQLRIPPVKNPTWFLLEHVDLKDVLLFTQSGDNDGDQDDTLQRGKGVTH